MSAPRSRRPLARTLSRVLVALALAASTLALAACDRPVPRVSLVANGDYLNTQATIWCFDGQRITSSSGCSQRQVDAPELTVRVGDQVGVEVPQQVRDRGWFVSIAIGVDDKGEPKYQRSPIQRDRSYFSFTVPEFPVAEGKTARKVSVRVFALGDSSSANSGVWQFVMANADAAAA